MESIIDKRKIEAIELLIEGKLTRENVAKQVGISNRQLYRWMNDEEFIAEWQKRTLEVQNQEKKFFNSKLRYATDKLWEIINSDVDVRTREKALEYWINRCMGTPTNKTEIDDKREEKGITDADIDKILNSNSEDSEEE